MWKHFDLIYELYLGLNESVRDGKSYASFARFLGVSVGKVQKWRELEQWPKAPDLMVLHDKLGLSFRWLVTGEGEPFESAPEAAASVTPIESPAIVELQPVPTEFAALQAEMDTLRAEMAVMTKEMAMMTKDLITTQKDLIAAKDRIIELQRNQRPGNSLIPTAE